MSYVRRNDSSTYHSILVDTEPKILKPIIVDRKKYYYVDPKNVLYY
jgi:tubulin delta